ncbi:MAG: hypothetical protein COA47_10925 [Robiginitomaculum sp.]|nr:MAG: hypothetical protein COA47_10925 [Robiginitomaculum sp.]
MGRSKLFLLSSVLLIAGCATLSEDECLTGNWQSIGYTDGAKGHAPDRIDDHNKACSKHGIPVDLETWLTGYDQGLDVYCTADNGAWIGASGITYKKVCTGPRGEAFQYGHQAGIEVYEAEEARDRARQDYATSEQELADLQQDIEYQDGRNRDTALTRDERDTALAELRRLERQYGRVEQQMHEISYAIDDLEDHAADLRNRLRQDFPNMTTY